MKKDSAPEFITHSCTHTHPVLEKLDSRIMFDRFRFRFSAQLQDVLMDFFSRRILDAHDKNYVVVYSKEATVISFSNLVYNNPSVRSFDIVKASVNKLRDSCIKALIKIR